jgi:hypothetical protein
MKKINFLFLILIISVSCKQDKPKPVVVKEVTPLIEEKKTVVINDTISGYINPKLGLYSFKFITDTFSLKKIRIYYEAKLVQTIKTNKMCENNQFSLIDWNFDGYKDISVISNCGSGGCAYWIWNYSPKLKRFVYNSTLSDVLGLEIDSVSKFIVFHFRDGCRSEKWDTMKYVNNRLVFVKGLYIERGTDGVSITRSKMVNNKIVTIPR